MTDPSASTPVPTVEERAGIFEILTTYLLYEKQEETQLRIAFAALTQQRHQLLHDKDQENPTEFTECGNLVCINALKILQESKKPRVEINDLSIQLIQNYNVKVQRDSVSRRCVAFLEEKPETKLIQ